MGLLKVGIGSLGDPLTTKRVVQLLLLVCMCLREQGAGEKF